MPVTRRVRLRGTFPLFAALLLGTGVLVASAQITPGIGSSPPAGESVVSPGAPAWIAVSTGGLALLTGSVPPVVSAQSKLPTVVNATASTLATAPASLGELVYRLTLTLTSAPPLTEVEVNLAFGGTSIHPSVYFATGTISLTGTLLLLVPLATGPAPLEPTTVTVLLNVCGGSCP